MSENRNILIHDPGAHERVLKIAARFSAIAEKVFYIDETAGESGITKEFVSNLHKSKHHIVEKLLEFRLILLHHTKKGFLPAVQCPCKVNYSTQWEHYTIGKKYWINRGIDALPDILTEDEARELWKWAVECKEEDMPAILLPPQGASGLIALSMLCQGYLAVHAEYAGPAKDWKDEELRPALEQMGWYALKEGSNLSLVPNNLGNKIGTVRKADWWLGVFDVFDNKNGQKKQIVEKKWDAFEKGLKTEWNESENGKVSNKLCELIALLHEQENVNQPDCVANAYYAIIKRLEKQPCNT